MRRAMRTSEAVEDQGHQAPVWVKEPERIIPRCLRCGAEDTERKVLHYLCDACIRVEHDTAALSREECLTRISALADAGLAALPEREQIRCSPPVQHHQQQLTARGLSPDVAAAHAESLVADPEHVASCAVCTEHREIGERIRRRQEDIVPLSRAGMEAIGPAIERMLRNRGGRRAA